MKRNQLFVAALLAASTCLSSSYALTEAQTKHIEQTVANVRLPELGATAAKLVIQAPVADKQEVAVTAVKAIVAKHPATAPIVVGSIAKVAPQLSPVVAATAAALSPEQAPAIARAAAAVAPEQADKIALAVSKVVRKSAVAIARAVMNAVPFAATRIVQAMGAEIPEVKGQLPRVRMTAMFGAADNPFGSMITTSDENVDINGKKLSSTNKTDEASTSTGKDMDRDTYGHPK